MTFARVLANWRPAVFCSVRSRAAIRASSNPSPGRSTTLRLHAPQVAFRDIHERADRDHSAIGDHVVVRLATSPALQADVRCAVTRSLELWWQFLDGIARTIDGS